MYRSGIACFGIGGVQRDVVRGFEFCCCWFNARNVVGSVRLVRESSARRAPSRDGESGIERA